MLITGILLMAGSALGYFWATNYINQNVLRAGFGALIGQSDPTFSLANSISTMGPFVFLLGAGLLILGLVRRKSQPGSQSN